MKNGKIVIDAKDLYYRDLNRILRETICRENPEEIELKNIFGQRYIGTNLRREVKLKLFGTPGGDLGAFMDGPIIDVYGNAQDGCGNTMNSGEIIIHGHAGDILGMSMRGGRIFVKDNVGYRVAIHMKEYEDKKPVIVIGGTAQDFLGEYMAGGIVILLGLNHGTDSYKSNFIGTGMHGGVIYIRGNVKDYQLGKEVGVDKVNEEDRTILEENIERFANHFGYKAKEISNANFIKLYPKYLRPYGKLYAY
ncbi:MAG: hypothetical protein ACE5IH_03085 [Thermodesulfobacteriota bacterium]